MTDKELHKLKRPELLQLMLEQAKENEQIKVSLEETKLSLEQANTSGEIQQGRLEEQDEKLESLQKELDDRDA